MPGTNPGGTPAGPLVPDTAQVWAKGCVFCRVYRPVGSPPDGGTYTASPSGLARSLVPSASNDPSKPPASVRKRAGGADTSTAPCVTSTRKPSDPTTTASNPRPAPPRTSSYATPSTVPSCTVPVAGATSVSTGGVTPSAWVATTRRMAPDAASTVTRTCALHAVKATPATHGGVVHSSTSRAVTDNGALQSTGGSRDCVSTYSPRLPATENGGESNGTTVAPPSREADPGMGCPHAGPLNPGWHTHTGLSGSLMSQAPWKVQKSGHVNTAPACCGANCTCTCTLSTRKVRSSSSRARNVRVYATLLAVKSAEVSSQAVESNTNRGPSRTISVSSPSSRTTSMRCGAGAVGPHTTGSHRRRSSSHDTVYVVPGCNPDSSCVKAPRP